MKKVIKIIFPESIKKILRKTENFFLRIKFCFKNPIVLEGVLGIKFLLYPDNRWPIRWTIEGGAYKKEYSAIDKLVNIGDTAFDVGSHVGMLGFYLAKKVGEGGKVYCFEPFPDSFNKLNINLALNKFNNVFTNNLAISDSIGTSKFYYQPNDYQLNSLGKVSDGIKKLSDSIDVSTETVDSYCTKNNINKINFLKIDTEGFEYNVLLGSEKMLNNKNIGIIQFEVAKTPLESIGKNPEEIIEYLNSKNYKVYEYIENSRTFKEINKITSGYDNFYSSFKDLTKI